jgi:Domain of unknown function (DUF4048)
MAQTTTIKAYSLEEADIASSTPTTKTSSSATEGAQRQTKRLTSSFPVLPPTTQVHVDHPTSFSPKHSSPAESARSSPRLAPQPASPTDPNNFLTTLAAQERRVFELREELQKAESDLAGLKRQWAIFEANRKKSGIRHVEQLQPLSSSHLSKTDLGGDIPMPLNASTFEKLAAKPARKPQQRVFSGSRHTRTLSLLTPASGDRNGISSEPFSNDVSAAVPDPENENNNPTLSRSSTMPNSEAGAGFGKTYKNLANRRSMPPPSADVLVKTGKQMASDLRDGLWTFFEDIRQATVGEEGISGTDTRNTTTTVRQKATSKSSPANGGSRLKRSSTAVGISARQTLDIASTTPQDYDRTVNTTDQSFWKEFGVDTPGKEGQQPPRRQEPKQQQQQQKQQQQQQQQEGLLIDIDVDDDWDAWESPVSQQKTSPRRNAEGQRDNSNNNKGALPWPELTKLTPSKLTRNVSDLMRDWDSPYSGQSTNTGEQALTAPHV